MRDIELPIRMHLAPVSVIGLTLAIRSLASVELLVMVIFCDQLLWFDDCTAAR